jgi:hypothetical protein
MAPGFDSRAFEVRGHVAQNLERGYHLTLTKLSNRHFPLSAECYSLHGQPNTPRLFCTSTVASLFSL